MININISDIILAIGADRILISLNLGFSHLDKFPNVILSNVVGVVWTARDLVESFTIRNFDFMSMQIIFCLKIA